MTRPLMVDVHMHLYETSAAGEWWKSSYEIWEYGRKDGIRFSEYGGSVEEAVDAMAEAGFSHGVAVNMFAAELFRDEAARRLPADLEGDERRRALADIEVALPEELKRYNRWLCEALAEVPQLTPFVAVDPWVLSPEANVAHLREMSEQGAKGIKLHPAAQRFTPSDPRMLPIYAACRELGLAVLSHSGTTRTSEQFAEPAAFADLLGRFPELTIVLAHLGGASWRQTVELADAFPQATFDLCEIIEWVGAPHAPSQEQLAAMIREVGADRVMLGTDFPWYDLDRTAALVLDLPLLSDEEKEKILGANAARILGLPV